MKKFYILIVAIVCSVSLQAQTTVNFTEAEGYVQGPLNDNANWGGAYWFVYPAAGDERITTTAGSAWAQWGDKFTMSVGDEMTFRLEFKFTGDNVQASKQKARVGFNTGGVAKYTTELLYLSTLNDGNLYVRSPTNVALTTGSSSLSDFQGDDLVIDLVIKIGADAASSSYSARLINVTDNVTGDVGIQNGINQTIYDKAITTGISGVFQTQAVTGTQYFTVTKISMTPSNTLSFDRTAELNFNLSQNPVKNELGITGLETGSYISIYSVTGAKVHSQEFNGNSIHVGNLNAGLYFLEIPGYSVKKFLKK